MERDVCGDENSTEDLGADIDGLHEARYDVPVRPATRLAGIVERMKEKRSGRYIVGLWEETIVSDLLWHTYSPKPKPTRRYAPSWFWASVETRIDPVANYDGELRALCEVQSIECPAEGADISDNMYRSWIGISGRLIPVGIHHEEEEIEFLRTTIHHYSLAQEANLPRIDRAEIWPDYELHAGPGQLAPGEQVYCLQIAQSNTLRFSLLLRPHTAGEAQENPTAHTTGKEEETERDHTPLGVYERTGVLQEAFGEDDGAKRVDEMLRAITSALPAMLGPELSNVENDAPSLFDRRAKKPPREQRAVVTVRATDRFPSAWSMIRIF